jgi:hypothetical protein
VCDSGIRSAVMSIAAIGRRCHAGHRTHGDDLAGTLLLHDRGDRVDRVDGAEQVHVDDKAEERRIEGAGLRVHRPTATSIGDQDIDPAPLLDDAGDHRVDGGVVRDIDLDPDGGPAHRLDLGDGGVGGR